VGVVDVSLADLQPLVEGRPSHRSLAGSRPHHESVLQPGKAFASMGTAWKAMEL
jgi:hypothetical protein